MTKNIFFNEQKWKEILTTRIDWYIVLYPEFEVILRQHEGDTPETKIALKNAFYGFMETLLHEDRVVLGVTGKNWDEERKPVDTVVIHHTKGESGVTWERLSAMQLMRLYAKSYFAPTTEKEIQGMPVFSNHFRDEAKTQMVFYAYHWLVRGDGTTEQLLPDEAIGWHAGNWDINCRSIAICLDGDFEYSIPPQAMIDGARRIITNHYAHVGKKNIIPHHNANPKTRCPGEWFEGVAWIK